MNCRQYISNKAEFNETLSEKDKATGAVVKLLGYQWDTEADVLFVKDIATTTDPTTAATTKRKVVQTLATPFDPMGHLAPILVPGKTFLQKLWKLPLTWDQELPAELQEEWRLLWPEFQKLSRIRIPRQIGNKRNNSRWILHGFTDASQHGYGAVLYIQEVQKDCRPLELHQVAAKYRVAPRKQTSIPRLELLGLYIGAKLANSIRNELQSILHIERIQLWCDSTCVLGWVYNPRTRNVFVDNRVRAIKGIEGVTVSYVPTEYNPADVLSRGCTVEELHNHAIWRSGPDMDVIAEAAKEFQPSKITEEMEAKTGTEDVVVALTTTEPIKKTDRYFAGLNYERYSSFDKLIRIGVYVCRFILLLWAGRQTCDSSVLKAVADVAKPSGWPSVSELTAVERGVISCVQQETFPELLDEKPTPMSNAAKSLINSLGVFRGLDGLLRCRGRQGEAEIPDAQKYPILLPSKHPVTRLIILKHHNCLKHDSVEHVLSNLRHEFWPLKGRQSVKTVLRSCVNCKRADGGPFRWQPMPDLPFSRISRERPFSRVGIDHFGPIQCSEGAGFSKVYGLLFVCMVVRAIHIEIVPSLSASAFLNGFRRFMARRGRPSLILTDRAGAFIAASKVLGATTTGIETKPTTATDTEPTIAAFCCEQRIQWEFRTPFSPWQHGFYERLIQDVKNALNKATWNLKLTMDDIVTTATETESIVNRRPLTYVGSEVGSWVLSPADYLLMDRPGVTGLDGPEPAEAAAEVTPHRLWEALQRRLKAVEAFWRLWIDRYLPSLRQQQIMCKENPRNASKQQPQVGEVVLIGDNNAPRNHWRLGKIEKLLPSRDGKVRAVSLRTDTTTGLIKPVNTLYPLELLPVEASAEAAEIKNTATTAAAVKRSKPRAVGLPLLLLLALVASAAADKCGANEKDIHSLQESHKCRHDGIALYQRSNGICYRDVKCGVGFLNGKGKCESNSICQCPKWASGCTFYEADVPEVAGTKEILSEEAPVVCSWDPGTPGCSKEPSAGHFAQIQLYDGSTHLVSRLQIVMAETTVPGEYYCHGRGTTSGTPTYCEKHNCNEPAMRFCYDKYNEIAYFETETEKIPVTAWGSVPKQYYGPETAPPQTPTCTSCSLRCIQGGVEVKVNEGMGEVGVCATPFCYSIHQPKRLSTVYFPAEVTMHPYSITLKVWSNGYLVKDVELACPANPFCDSIQCTFCWNRVFNPQCAPTLALLPIMGMVYFGSMTLYILGRLLKGFCYGCYWSSYSFHRICLCCVRWIRRTQQPEEDPQQPRLKLRQQRRPSPGRSGRGSSLTSVIVLCAIATFPLTRACAEVSSLVAKRSSCEMGRDKEVHCVLTETTRLALVPQGQDTCLLIKDPNGEPIGTLLLEVTKLGLKCAKTNEYFTRSFRMQTSGMKRCRWKGECTGDKCGETGPDTKIEDLGDTANQSPGFTHCVESCGCWACNCFNCGSACFFYRNYAESTSPTIYEVFRCPTWSYEVEVYARVLLQGQTSSHRFILQPGIPSSWNHMRVTLIATTTPQLPVLGSKFLTDGSRTVLVQASASGQPVTGTLGQLQCASKTRARDFDCFLPKDICNCDVADDRVRCNCDEQSYESLFDDTDRLLPLMTNGVHLTPVGGSVTAALEYNSALELQVSLEGFRLTVKVDKSSCLFQDVTISGCYSCVTGAKIQYTCRTDFGEALAHVQCGSATFSTLCTPTGLKATATLMFDHAKISEICVASCPAGDSEFNIEASLVFISKERLGNLSSMLAGGSEAGGGVNPDLGFLAGIFSGNLLLGILAVVAAILLAALSIPLIVALARYLLTRRWAASRPPLLRFHLPGGTGSKTPPQRQYNTEMPASIRKLLMKKAK